MPSTDAEYHLIHFLWEHARCGGRRISAPIGGRGTAFVVRRCGRCWPDTALTADDPRGGFGRRPAASHLQTRQFLTQSRHAPTRLATNDWGARGGGRYPMHSRHHGGAARTPNVDCWWVMRGSRMRFRANRLLVSVPLSNTGAAPWRRRQKRKRKQRRRSNFPHWHQRSFDACRLRNFGRNFGGWKHPAAFYLD